jgi:hypothetical protein
VQVLDDEAGQEGLAQLGEEGLESAAGGDFAKQLKRVQTLAIYLFFKNLI